MNLLAQASIAVIAVVAAIVALATKIVELKSALIKHHAEKKTPEAATATQSAAQQTGKREIWRAIEGIIQLICGCGFIVLLMSKNQPATTRDIGVGCLAILLIASGITLNGRKA